MKRIKIGTFKGCTEPVYLEKHSFDCDWYWGFGYLGNDNCHFHMRDVLYNESDSKNLVFDVFTIELDSRINGWWLMEAFKRAYIYKEYMEMLYTGGAYISHIKDRSEKDLDEYKKIKKKLSELLDYIWNTLEEKLEKENGTV